MKENIGIAASLWLRYIICAFVALFIFISVSVIAVGSFTEVIGYEVYSAENNELLYTHYLADGEDAKAAEYEEQGIEILRANIRSEVTGTPKIVYFLIAQLLSGAITVAFIYKRMWSLGDGDANLVNFGHRQKDMLRGIKIGLIAIVPNFITWLLLVIAKLGVIGAGVMPIYRFANYQHFALISLIFGDSTTTVGDVSWVQIFLGLSVFVALPLIAQIGYTLGYKRISLKEKMIYQKKDRG